MSTCIVRKCEKFGYATLKLSNFMMTLCDDHFDQGAKINRATNKQVYDICTKAFDDVRKLKLPKAENEIQLTYRYSPKEVKSKAIAKKKTSKRKKGHA